MQLYEQIYHDLFRKISVGELKSGDLCPSEKELEQQYKVSKAPVRQAMAKLESLGMIERKRGKGTFVKSNDPKDYRLDLCGFTSKFYDSRDDLKYKTASVNVVQADDKISEKLDIPVGTNVIEITRIGSFKEEIIQYSKHYVSCPEKIDVVRDEGNIVSWRFFLEGKLDIAISHTKDEVRALLADKELQSHFNSHENPAPVLLISRVSYSSLNKPQEYSEFYMMTDIWEYTIFFNS